MNAYSQHKTTPLTCLVLAAMGLFTATAGAAEPGLHGWVFGQAEDGKYIGMVPHAQIELKDQGGAVAQQVTADEKGYFKVTLVPGTYYYKVTAPGFRDENKGRGVQVKQAEQFEWYNFALTKESTDPDVQPPDTPVVPVVPVLPEIRIGRLHGHVFERTARGLEGIPGAMVTLRRVGSARAVQVISGLADAGGPNGGRYATLLRAGTWHASVEAQGFARFVDPTPIVIVAGEDTRRDFVLSRPDIHDDQGIRGNVTLILAEPPIPDAQLDFRDLGGPLVASLKISEWRFPVGKGHAVGQYAQPLFPGRFAIEAKAEGYTSTGRKADVVAGQWSRVDLTLHRGTDDGKFKVTVRVETDAGAPVRGARVVVQRGVSLQAASDKTGLAHFECKQGIWKATAAIPGLTQVKPVPVRFKVGPAASNSAVVVMSELVSPDPDKKSVVMVTVTDDRRKRLPGMRVVFRGEGQSERGMTNDQGEARFQAQKHGKFVVGASGEGYGAGGKEVAVLAPMTKVHIVLAQAAKTKLPVQATTCPLLATQCPPTPTQCASVRTKCPKQDTMCPIVRTRCPPVRTECSPTTTTCKPAATYCPTVKTVCPAERTVCRQEGVVCPPDPGLTRRPSSPTTCPRSRTRCPAIPTVCGLGVTRCPPVETVCATERTKCPVEETKCPVRLTKCPPMPTRCQGATRCAFRSDSAGTRPCIPTRDQIATTRCPVVETKCPTSQTKCPALRTKCPAERTACRPDRLCLPTRGPSVAATRCPVVETKCPTSQTKCPALRTKCPAERTACRPDRSCYPTCSPAVRTQCPRVQTKCPSNQPGCSSTRTREPVISTICPPVSTRCPSNRPGCSPRPTQAPVVATQCPRVFTKCPSAQPGCGSRPTQAPAVSTRCPTRSTVCPRSSTRCPALRTRCPACGIQSTVTRYPVVRTQCPIIRTRCPRCSLPPRGIDRIPRNSASIPLDADVGNGISDFRAKLPPASP